MDPMAAQPLFDSFDVSDLLVLNGIPPNAEPLAPAWNNELDFEDTSSSSANVKPLFSLDLAATAPARSSTAMGLKRPRRESARRAIAIQRQHLEEEAAAAADEEGEAGEAYAPRSTSNKRRRTAPSATAASSQEEDEEAPTHDSNGKKLTKKQLNKLAADKYRRKKREEFERLSTATEQLTGENKTLRVKCTKLEEEVSYLKGMLVLAVRGKANPHDIAAVATPDSERDAASLERAALETNAASRLASIEAQLYTLTSLLSQGAQQ